MRRAALTVGILAIGLLPGCGGDDGESKGKVAKGTGYEVTLPEGWKASDQQADVGKAGFSTDSVWFGPVVEGFRINGNVIIEGSVSSGVTARQYVEAGQRLARNPRARRQLGFSAAPSDFQPLRPIELDGDPAIESGFSVARDGKVVRNRQVVAIHDGSAYTITYSAPRDRFDDQLGDFQRIVRSWHWD